MSLRATGEGHISSITFRVGVLNAQHRITLMPPVEFATEPERVPNPAYDITLFARKLQELLQLSADTRAELGLAARRAVVDRWSWSKVAALLLEPFQGG